MRRSLWVCALIVPLYFLTSSAVHAQATIGTNFTGVDRPAALNFIPPDTTGAIGPNNFVELVNNNFTVYNRSGGLVSTSSMDSFWTSKVGLPIVGANTFTFDPRIIYDSNSG